MVAIASIREVARNNRVSTRLVAAGSTLTLTQAEHEGKTICLDTTTGCTVTLPQATGSGATYKFLQTVVATTSSHIIKVANTTDVMSGFVYVVTTSSDNAECFATSATSDTITLNRTTMGGTQIGERFEIIDAASGVFTVMGFTRATGSEASPFSAAV